MIFWLITAAAVFFWLPVIVYRAGRPYLHAAAPCLLLLVAVLAVALGGAGIKDVLVYALYCTCLYAFSTALVGTAHSAERFMLPEILTAICSLGMFGGLLMNVGSRSWGLSLILKTSVPLNTGHIFGINVLHGLFYNQTPLSGFLMRFTPWWQVVLIPGAAALILCIPAVILRSRAEVQHDH